MGQGAWVVHNASSCPNPLEIGNWTNRLKGKAKGLFSHSNGIYEYRSGGAVDGRIYVGESSGQSVIGRLKGKLSNFGRNLDNVVWSAIDFNGNKTAAKVAERVRIEQLMAQPNIGVYGVVNAFAENLDRTASRAEAIDFMTSGKWKEIKGWPDWLQLPTNMVDLPDGMR